MKEKVAAKLAKCDELEYADPPTMMDQAAAETEIHKKVIHRVQGSRSMVFLDADQFELVAEIVQMSSNIPAWEQVIVRNSVSRILMLQIGLTLAKMIAFVFTYVMSSFALGFGSIRVDWVENGLPTGRFARSLRNSAGHHSKDQEEVTTLLFHVFLCNASCPELALNACICLK